MKKKFNVNFKADTWYYAIEAETQEEAIRKALDSFLEYEPDIYCEESKEEDDPCIGCPHEGFGSEHCAAGIGDYCRAGGCIIEDEDPSCSTCANADQDTTNKVACCNCCEEYSFYTRA